MMSPLPCGLELRTPRNRRLRDTDTDTGRASKGKGKGKEEEAKGKGKAKDAKGKGKSKAHTLLSVVLSFHLCTMSFAAAVAGLQRQMKAL